MLERKVVVLSKILIQQRSDRKMFAAHIPALGLTAYGRNAESAVNAVQHQFHRFITSCRQLGVLEKRLNQVGVKWYWEDQYPKDGQPITYTDAGELIQKQKKLPSTSADKKAQGVYSELIGMAA